MKKDNDSRYRYSQEEIENNPVLIIRHRNEIYSKNLSKSTKREYHKIWKRLQHSLPSDYILERMRITGKKISYATFRLYRVAALHLYTLALEKYSGQGTDTLPIENMIEAVKNDQYPFNRYEPSQQSLRQLEKIHGKDLGKELAVQRARGKQKRKSKKLQLKFLKPGWQKSIENEIYPKYKSAAVIIHNTGCRPAALQKGITISLSPDNKQLKVRIEGVKQGEGKGQPWYILTLSRDEGFGKNLYEHFQKHLEKNGKVFYHLHTSVSNFSHVYENAAERKFRRKKFTPYIARHNFAAVLKSELKSREEYEALTQKARKNGKKHGDFIIVDTTWDKQKMIAKAMGHQAISSQQVYGFPRQSGGSGLKSVEAPIPVRGNKMSPGASAGMS